MVLFRQDTKAFGFHLHSIKHPGPERPPGHPGPRNSLIRSLSWLVSPENRQPVIPRDLDICPQHAANSAEIISDIDKMSILCCFYDNISHFTSNSNKPSRFNFTVLQAPARWLHWFSARNQDIMHHVWRSDQVQFECPGIACEYGPGAFLISRQTHPVILSFQGSSGICPSSEKPLF